MTITVDIYATSNGRVPRSGYRKIPIPFKLRIASRKCVPALSRPMR
jgi:hypothetical protein